MTTPGTRPGRARDPRPGRARRTDSSTTERIARKSADYVD